MQNQLRGNTTASSPSPARAKDTAKRPQANAFSKKLSPVKITLPGMSPPSSPTTLTQDAPATLTDWANLSVEELIIKAQQRAEKPHHAMRALEELVKRHQKKVTIALYHLAPERNDIADMAQEVLMRMCRSIGSLRNPKTFNYWLNRIITNLFYDTLRKKRRQLPTSSLDAPVFDDDDKSAQRDIPDENAHPERQAMGSELDTQIRDAIDALPEHFRQVIVLRELQGLTYEEIAQLTDTELGTVKSRLARARLRLQTALAPYLKPTGEPDAN